ncbi:hypothetical protein BJ741DRAFT_12437 [Chytriomyces cf. hyalinus JEL632]|nr:hypothetical protein BJ741DRAFT_12437 [Chytriomyces cf. hyalinus JEL632]
MALDHEIWWYSLLYSCTEATGVILNACIVILNAASVHKLSQSSFLLFWLCFCDLITAITGTMSAANNLIRDATPSESDDCSLKAAILVTAGMASLLLCSGLTFFRYITILKQRTLPPNFATIYLLCVGLVSLGVALLPFVMGSASWFYKLRQSKVYCSVDWSQRDWRSCIVSLSCGIICASTLGFIGYAYMGIYAEAARVFKGMEEHAAGIPGSASPGCVEVVTDGILRDLEQNAGKSVGNAATVEEDAASVSNTLARATRIKAQRSEDEKRQNALLKQSVIVVTAYIIGWSPYLLMGLYEFISAKPVGPVFDFIPALLIPLYGAINPVIIFNYDRDIKANCMHWLPRSRAN